MPSVLAGLCRVDGARAPEGLVGLPGCLCGRPRCGGGGPAAAPWRLPCVIAAVEEELEHTGPWRARRPFWSLERAREVQ